MDQEREVSLMFDLLFHEDQSSLCGKMIIFVQSENGTSKISWLYGFKKKKKTIFKTASTIHWRSTTITKNISFFVILP